MKIKKIYLVFLFQFLIFIFNYSETTVSELENKLEKLNKKQMDYDDTFFIEENFLEFIENSNNILFNDKGKLKNEFKYVDLLNYSVDLETIKKEYKDYFELNRETFNSEDYQFFEKRFNYIFNYEKILSYIIKRIINNKIKLYNDSNINKISNLADTSVEHQDWMNDIELFKKYYEELNSKVTEMKEFEKNSEKREKEIEDAISALKRYNELLKYENGEKNDTNRENVKKIIFDLMEIVKKENPYIDEEKYISKMTNIYRYYVTKKIVIKDDPKKYGKKIDDFVQARLFFDEGRYEEAYELLKDKLNEMDTSEKLYLFGNINYKLGYKNIAEYYYREALKLDPKAKKINLDLIDIYTNRFFENKEKAEEQIRNLKQNTNIFKEKVFANQLKDKLALYEEKKKNENLNIYTINGTVYSDNANSGTTEDRIIIDEQEIDTPEAYKKTGDFAVYNNVTINYRFLNLKKVKSSYNFDYTRYLYVMFNENSYEDLSNMFNIKLNLNSLRMNFPLAYRIRIANYKKVASKFGLGIDTQFWLGDSIIINPYMNFSLIDDAVTNNEGKKLEIDFNTTKIFSKKLYTDLLISYNREAYTDYYQNNQSYSYYLDLGYIFRENINIKFSGGYYQTKFENIQKGDISLREDSGMEFSILYNYLFTNGVSAKLGYMFQNQDSNINLNKYNKNQISIGIEKQIY